MSGGKQWDPKCLTVNSGTQMSDDISGIQTAETNLAFGHHSNNGLKMASIGIETAPFCFS